MFLDGRSDDVFYFSFLADGSKKCGRGFGVGFVPGGGVGPFRCIYFVSRDSTQQECLSRCDVLSFLAVSKHTHTEAQQRALTNSRIRGCVQQARARSLPNSSTHMFTAAVCARGGAAAGWIEKVSERLQACRGARCSVSDWAAGEVCARRRGEAEGRLLLRGAGCIVERSACTWCCMMCVQAGCQAVQQTEQMSARARARAGACVRARLAWCRICVVLAARPGTAACEMPEAVCRACTGRKKAR